MASFRPPSGTRLYAVGDIHGRADLLARLQEMIRADAEQAPEQRKVVVYLGDYIDRGPDSAEVIGLLIARPLSVADAGIEEVHLIGNHEAMMLSFLKDPQEGMLWLMNGGDATVASYGLDLAEPGGRPVSLEAMSRALFVALPASHHRFLAGLSLSHLEGDYLMVHAGIRPGVPLQEHSARDILWIRREFLDSALDHGVLVVHGHTVSERPQVRPNRIGIDTGARFTGCLTCLVAHDETAEFLQT